MSKTTIKHAHLRYRPAYFNTVAYANIPEGWDIVESDTGAVVAVGCHEADARALAARFGYVVKGGN